LQVLTGLFLITSFLTGILAVINRLEDFRKTAQLTKKRKKKFEHNHNIISLPNIKAINSEIKNLDSETKKLGVVTWKLLKWQIWTFLIGTIIGVIFMIVEKNICI